MNFTIADVHWTAGFMDGDGTFGLRGTSPRMGATQAELFPLEKLACLWGGSISPKKRNIGFKPLFQWAFYGPHSVGLMMMLHDLMSRPRQKQIAAMFPQWKANGNLSGEGHYAAALSDDEALLVMQDVLDGAPVTRAANKAGISHASLIGWLNGTRRPSLLKKLQNISVEVPRKPSPVFAQTLSNQLVCDMHYSAGFLEAEGCFSTLANTVRIQGIQLDIEPLEKLRRLWGGAIYSRKTSEGKRPVSAWHLNGPAAAGLMMTMYPLMSPSRQEQIAKALGAWRLRKIQHGETHHDSVATDEQALRAMRYLRDGSSYEVVAETSGVSRFVLGMWMRGRNRPYLLKQLEAEGKPSQWQYNGGRRKRITISDDNALAAVRRVRAGDSINSVARSFNVVRIVVLDWVRGKNRPYLLAQVLQEEQQRKGNEGIAEGETLPLPFILTS